MNLFRFDLVTESLERLASSQISSMSHLLYVFVRIDVFLRLGSHVCNSCVRLTIHKYP